MQVYHEVYGVQKLYFSLNFMFFKLSCKWGNERVWECKPACVSKQTLRELHQDLADPRGWLTPWLRLSGLALLMVLGAGMCLCYRGCSPHTYSLVPILFDTKKNKGKSLPV